jgi:hypothetical protein
VNRIRRDGARIEKLREAAIERQQARLQQDADLFAAEQKRTESWRKAEVKSKANKTSVPYDVISLEATNVSANQRLVRKDEQAKRAAILRMKRLNEMGNGRYDPITGQERMQIAPPQPPAQ